MAALEIAVSFQICDQCYRRRSKCTRQLPSCARCTSNHVKCTYERETRQKSNINNNPQFYQGTSTFSIKKRFFPRPNRRQSVKEIRDLTSEFTSVPRTTVVNKDDWSQQALVIKDFNSRSIYNVLSCMVGAPILQNQKPRLDLLSLYIQLFGSAGLTFTRTKNLTNATTKPIAALSQYYFLLSSAKAAYFKYINAFCPLFLESTFEEWRRPPLLMTAIWASGLSFLPRTDLCTKLISSLHTQIIQMLGSAHYKPTLSSLQTLLVCLIGGKEFPSMGGFIIGRFELIIPTIFQLGLHRNLPSGRADPNTILERRLAFSAVLYFNSGNVFGYGSSSAICYSQFEPDICLLKAARQLTSSINDLGATIVSQSGYLTSVILSRLQALRHLKETSFEEIVLSCDSILRIFYSCMKVLYEDLETLRMNSHGLKFSDLLNVYLFILKARHDSILFYLYRTLYHCASIRSLPLATTNQYLGFSMTHCMRLIENTSNIPSEQCIYIFLGPCSYAVTWLSSNYSTFPNTVTAIDSIRLGLSVLKKGTECPGITQSARVLLGLATCIVNTLGINACG